MCAIFQLLKDDEIDEIRDIAKKIDEKYGEEIAEQCTNVDIYPKGNAPVIGPGGKVSLLKWGFPMRDTGKVVFNARAESLTEKAMFRECLSNRCLVPASFFYEFGADKKKYRYTVDGSRLLYLAALWRTYAVGGKKSHYFTIITTESVGRAANIHARMPAIIRPGDRSEWLAGDRGSLRLLNPFSGRLTIESA